MKQIARIFFGLALLTGFGIIASGQTSSSPPADDEPDFIVPARPTFSNPAEFQKAGVLQLEFGYNANFHGAGLRAEHDNPMALRFAASNRVLLEFDSDNVISQHPEPGKVTTGFGDTQLGIQTVLEHEHGSRPGIAFAYYIKLPTADSSKGLGTGRVDHDFTAFISKKLGETTVDFNVIYLLAGRTTRSGHASSGQAAIAASRNVSKRFGVQGEISGFSRNDAQPGATFGLGVVTFQVNRRLVFDAGVRTGLTHGAPHVGAVAGLTVGVSDLYRKKKNIY